MANTKRKSRAERAEAKLAEEASIRAFDEIKAQMWEEGLRRLFSGEADMEREEEDHVERVRRLFEKPEAEPVFEPMPKNFSEADKFYARGMGITLDLDGI